MITIARVTAEDIPEVKQLLSETWIDTYGGILSPRTIQTVTTAWHAPHLLAQQAQNPDLFFAVAKDEHGKKLGLITVGKTEPAALMLYRLYVHPDFQRQGIGSQLIEAALKEFPAAQKMQLEVEAENKKGIAFYLKSGFNEITRRDETIESEVLKVIVMEKALA